MSIDKTQSNNHNSAWVIVTPCLGVVRGFGKRGIPVIYIDSERVSIARYSRYISHRLKCLSPSESEDGFISALLDFGKKLDSRIVIIATADEYVLTLSKHKRELEQFYIIPLPSFKIMQSLVSKKRLYRLCAEMRIPHPKTYFPNDSEELKSMGREIEYPYIIKPEYSLAFQRKFLKKCLVIESPKQLDWAAEKLKNKDFEVMIQEIIPGRELYNVCGYFDQKSEPVAVCGWDKIRQYPPDFGSGTYCISRWRPSPIDHVTSFLKAVGFYGVGEVELKKDPRDDIYKLIEVNARTTSQNRLAAACGVDAEYIAYLDVNGYDIEAPIHQYDNIIWVDDFTDFISCLIDFKRGNTSVADVFRLLMAKKVHSIVSWADPAPVIARIINLGRRATSLLMNSLSSRLRKSRI